MGRLVRASCELLFNGLAGGDVTIDDDQLFDLALGIANGAGGGFKDTPGTILVARAVLEALADAGFPHLPRSFEDLRAIVGMNLFEDGPPGEFRGGIAEDFVVRRAVVKTAAFEVDEGDHGGRVFGNDLEQLVAFGGAAGAEVDQELLCEE